MKNVAWAVLCAIACVSALLIARRDITHQRKLGVVFAEAHVTDGVVSLLISGCVGIIVGVVGSFALIDTWTMALCVVMVFTGLRMSWIDIDTHTIPYRVVRECVLFAIPLVAVMAMARSEVSLLGMMWGSAVMWCVMRAIEHLSRGQMGHADVVCASYLGVFVGAIDSGAVWMAVAAAFMAAGIVAFAVVVVGRASRYSHLPFGPFLFFGAVYAVLR